MPPEPVVLTGRLGWGNRKNGLEAYGPGGRWYRPDNLPADAPSGDLLGDALDRADAGEGAALVVAALPRRYCPDPDGLAGRLSSLLLGLLLSEDAPLGEHLNELHGRIAEALASGGPVEDELDAATEVLDTIRRYVAGPTDAQLGRVFIPRDDG